MYTVNQVSKKTGVSVRTLHHYDAIGLLQPAEITPAGYRLYDDGQLMRLQSILMFRELRFSLSEIKCMLDSPGFDMRKALRQQIELLEKERAHLDNLIGCARELQEKGEKIFMFDALDRTEMENYKKEAYEKWGETAAWKEYARVQHLHGAVLSYLELRPKNFYRVEADVDGLQFVTARGWEDLSNLMMVYEEMGIPVDETVVHEFLHHKDP